MDALHVVAGPDAPAQTGRWTEEQAWDWYRGQPWICGGNFTPSTAINQLEFWQAETFDPETIDRELGYAAGVGMNAVRAYLHDVAFEVDASGLLGRIDSFLELCAAHGIRPLLTLFDDCWNAEFAAGPQPAPRPGVHNSGWVQSPGPEVVQDASKWPRLERYVKTLLHTFGEDGRVLGWDLYNEPGNGGMVLKSAPLLRQAFAWAREVRPTQPLTAGAWGGNAEMDALMATLSDVVTFHHYESLAGTEAFVERLKAYRRPIFCTEWLARIHQQVETHLPWFRSNGIGCIHWGVVAGKTQTRFPWGSPEAAPEPELWFHDVFHPDGTPYRESEAAAFREQRRLAGC